jgi:regulator of replication initiation timing
MSEPTVNEVLADMAYLKDQIDALTKQRDTLPRNDKQGAHRLLQEITSLQAEHKRLRPVLVHARTLEEKRELHGLWVSAVATLYGKQAPAECFDWMRQERRRRREPAAIVGDQL